MCELNIRARSSRPLSLRRCIDQLRIRDFSHRASLTGGLAPEPSVILTKRWRSCSEMLFEEKIGVWIVVKAVYLAPSGIAIKLESVRKGAVRIEPKSFDR